MTVTTAWIKVGGIQNEGLVDFVQILLDRKSACDLKVEIAYDYNETFVDSETILDASLSSLNPTQFRVALSNKDCQAVKVRISDNNGNQDGECYSITGLRFEIADEGHTRLMPDAQIGAAE
jgi:hypothetical protein